MNDDEDVVGFHWWVGRMVCAICCHEHTAVIPIPVTQFVPDNGSECDECHAMACIPIEEEDD